MKKLFNRNNLANILTPLFIVAAAFLSVSILLVISGFSPVQTFTAMFKGAFGSGMGIINTLTKAVPICLCTLGVALARQAGIFNIGMNGQMLIGSIGTVAAGIYLKGLPTIIHVPLALLAGMLMGMLYAAIPTIIYLKKRIQLIVIFLLMNTIAGKLVTYVVFEYMKDPKSQSNATFRIEKSAELPNLIRTPARLNIGVLIALAVCIIVYIYFYKTTAGYELRATGMNKTAADYAGIPSKKYLASSLLLGGALAGLAGGIEILGTYFRLYDGISPAYGFDGIPIALLTGGNPIGAIIGSILFGAMRVGSANMQIKVGVASELVDVIQGALICFIALEYIFHFLAGKLLEGKKKDLKEKEAA